MSASAPDALLPLGSLRTWVRDLTLSGALMPASALSTFMAIALVATGPPPRPWDLAELFLAALIAGALVGGLLAPPLWIAARLCWSCSRLLTLAVGPLFGALAGILIIAGMGALIREGGLSWGDLWLASGLGAFGAGPPWVAYVAVRAAGRSTLGLVLAAAVWMAVPASLLVLYQWPR